MLFIEKCKHIIHQYESCNDYKIEENKTIRLGLNEEKPLYSRFTFYAPVNPDWLEDFVKKNYKREFPETLMELYHSYNGLKMYTGKAANKLVKWIAVSGLTIFGFPPFPRNDFTPFDIRVEDLARGSGIQKRWLKCGAYCPLPNTDMFDIFIDTYTTTIYVTEHRGNRVIETFNSLDECLCELSDRLSKFDLDIIIPR